MKLRSESKLIGLENTKRPGCLKQMNSKDVSERHWRREELEAIDKRHVWVTATKHPMLHKL